MSSVTGHYYPTRSMSEASLLLNVRPCRSVALSFLPVADSRDPED